MKKPFLIIISIIFILFILISVFIAKYQDESGSFQDYCTQNKDCINNLKQLCVDTNGDKKSFCGSYCKQNGYCTDVCSPYYDYCKCTQGRWNYKKGCQRFLLF